MRLGIRRRGGPLQQGHNMITDADYEYKGLMAQAWDVLRDGAPAAGLPGAGH